MDAFIPVTLNVLLIGMRLKDLIYFAEEKNPYKRFSNILHSYVVLTCSFDKHFFTAMNPSPFSSMSLCGSYPTEVSQSYVGIIPLFY